MPLRFSWSRLESLSTLYFYEMVKARESVFVVEQQCAYQEVDEMDLHSWHLFVSMEGEMAAYVRVVDPGVKYSQPSIGRVMTLAKFRRRKVGRALMTEAIRFTEQTFPGMGIKISAQVYLSAFYQSLGFKAVSEPYDEDGIRHIDMLKPAVES
ncbi:GNAT family N-acetyltransferase [Halomonas llamarensis]|uniref:GNAT family N-acetyltransferase n=1 Tax=Halomonas llamarensis TaxID=2945104 RepID=A0ABT0SM32_9GAMM|nr:GNAT family N-acetyltransferase [Halomonas llamarensis]MCL7928847.1 GNAT family N-acetyltransferase [Halomonas llamarensis]